MTARRPGQPIARLSEPRWEHFAHGADAGVRGVGATREEAFEQAARGLTAVVTDPRSVAPSTPQRFELEAEDDELLLYRWLNALVSRMSVESMLFSRFHLLARPGGLVAEAWGEPVDVPRHRPRAEVKGATFTELVVRRDANGSWTAQCVVDV